MDESSNNEGRTEPGKAGDSRAQPDTVKVSVGEALLLFEEAGLPRNKRSIRRYCTEGSMSCFKVDTNHGRQWMVDRVSAEKYIVQLQQAHDLTFLGYLANLGAQPVLVHAT